VPAAVFRALTLSAALALSGRAEATPLPLRGSEAEQFLRRARVLELKPLGVGVTHSEKATLSDGVLTLKAVWVIDRHPGALQLWVEDAMTAEKQAAARGEAAVLYP
jgi:hypothetical protein